jgi:hypothetical protein
MLVSDLLHFAPKLALDPDHASSLFDRLDSDNDGFLDEHDWERVTNTLTCTFKHAFLLLVNRLYFYFPVLSLNEFTRAYLRFVLVHFCAIFNFIYSTHFYINSVSLSIDESLVRAEAHPIYCGYFKMQQLGSLSHDRLAEIATSKGLDAAILNRPDEMLPLSPTHSSNKVGFVLVIM